MSGLRRNSSLGGGGVAELQPYRFALHAKSHGHGAESRESSIARARIAPSMASQTVAQGKVVPALFESATAIARAVAVCPVHTSGSADGVTSLVGMGCGGDWSCAASVSRPGWDGLRENAGLAGSEPKLALFNRLLDGRIHCVTADLRNCDGFVIAILPNLHDLASRRNKPPSSAMLTSVRFPQHRKISGTQQFGRKLRKSRQLPEGRLPGRGP